jgi:A/G-specific adenine glycosylase
MPVESEARFAHRILRWFDGHARDLPWRLPPGTALPLHDPAWPYRVWLSEIMLQQTTVTAVKPYFAAFTARWPSVERLAAAADADVMAAWAGLGYYARARNLLACARKVVAEHGGQFPRHEAVLLTLPGVGAYTAAAIASIAFGERAVVVDGNVERVIARHRAVAIPLPAARPELRRLADGLTPDQRPGDYAQALMDLGATICTPRSPACLMCPVSVDCAGRDQAERFPVKAAKAAKPHRTGLCWWIERGDSVLLVTRDAKRMLGGMRALPSDDWDVKNPPLRAEVAVRSPVGGVSLPPEDAPNEGADQETVLPLRPPAGATSPLRGGFPSQMQWPNFGTEEFETLGTVTHVFTHFSLTLEIRRLNLKTGCSLELDGEWWPKARLDDAGLPSLFVKAAQLALGRI